MISFLGRGKKSALPTRMPTELAAIRAYWESLRVNGVLPQRAQLDPRGMANALEHVFLIERMAPGLARFRLVGSQVNSYLGMDMRGMPFSALFTPDARTRLADALELSFSMPSILELRLEAERSLGKPELSGRLLLLPLAERASAPAMALGCLICDGTTGRAPRRFAISNLMREAIAQPKAEMMTETPPNESAAGESQEAVPLPPRAKPALRLVYSRD